MIIERCSFSTVQATARFAPPDGSLPPPYVESATPIDPRPPRLGRERLEVTRAARRCRAMLTEPTPSLAVDGGGNRSTVAA